MIAINLVTEEVPTLKPESTLNEAKAVFMDYCLCHIPIVKEEQYIGVFPFDLVNSGYDEDQSIADYKDDFILVYADAYQHILNIFELAAENELTVIPVIEENNHYKGAITINNLLNYFAGIYSFREAGGIFTLKVPFQNYDLSEIARIVESNNAKILSLYTQTTENSSVVYITLKVNTLDIRSIQATFERFDYEIDVHHTYDKRETDLQERYDLLMKYLNV